MPVVMPYQFNAALFYNLLARIKFRKKNGDPLFILMQKDYMRQSRLDIKRIIKRFF